MVTGASAGLGRAIACEFAKHGARIGLLARGKAGLEAQRRSKSVQRAARRSSCRPMSPTPTPSKTPRPRSKSEFGPIDVWINNAMVSVFSPVKEMKAGGIQARDGCDLSRRCEWHPRRRSGACCRATGERSCRSAPPSPIAAFRLQSAYCAAKHAIVGFTDSLRCELIHDRSRVSVTVVHMPALNTPQFGWVKSRLRTRRNPCRRFSSRKSAPEPCFGPRITTAAKSMWEVQPSKPLWATKSRRASLTIILGQTGYDSQQTSEPEDPKRPDNLWDPVDC